MTAATIAPARGHNQGAGHASAEPGGPRPRNHHRGTLYSCVPSRGAATVAPCIRTNPARLDGSSM